MAQLGDLKLESGAVIKNFRMSYVTHGKLNAANNAILFHHGFAAQPPSVRPHDRAGQAARHRQVLHHLPRRRWAPRRPATSTRPAPTNSGLKMSVPVLTTSATSVKASVPARHRSAGYSHLLAVTGISSGGRRQRPVCGELPQFMDGIFPIVGRRLWNDRQAIPFGHAGASIIEIVPGMGRRQLRREPASTARPMRSRSTVHYFYTQEWWDTVRRYARGLHDVAQHDRASTTSTCRTRATSTTGSIAVRAWVGRRYAWVRWRPQARRWARSRPRRCFIYNPQ